MRRSICCGTFMGGEIEPGTFHEQVTRDPKDEDADPSTGESDGPDAANPAAPSADPDEARDH